MTVPSQPSIATEARYILKTSLLQDKVLRIPQKITSRLSSVTFTPTDAPPIAPTPCKLSESAAALWALVGLFSAVISEERYGVPDQHVTVDVHTATLFPMSTFMFELDGKGIWHPEVKARMDFMDPGKFTEPYRGLATNIYKTADARYFQLHGGLDTTAVLHMLEMPQHRLELTGTDAAKIKSLYAEGVGRRTAEWLDLEANEFWRQAGTICYTQEEFMKTPHGQASIGQPLYSVDAVHTSLSPVAWAPTCPQDTRNRPLAGIKVLDLTRVVAGPTISKILALAGADVLRISSLTVPEASSLVFDMQIGKRDCHLDLKTVEGKLAFRNLVEEADVIVDGYRPGSLEKMGFGRTLVHEIARKRGRGMVYARENCYGWVGEWRHRSGWQQISDCVTGVSWAQGKFLGLDEPVIPLLPNSDYQTGIIGAIGILQALLLRSTSGGSYNVDTSLNAFNLWYLNLGFYSPDVSRSILAKHPDFKPRHTTDVFTLFDMTRQTCRKATGEGKGELFDPARFITEEVRWGKKGENGRYLDWTKLITFSAAGEEGIRLGYDRGSTMPGSDEPVW
ncbi:CAIB/BAIF family enzyme [Lepidopterella palustris CBS 459.81]|uniref:CAIB/BAIF family enzyme n=1 Tax=Lepidopterella palustris CBS 459.81 TaxID=1314670 RepID=A0A8E2E651_9PEZI|nr:CAIB/BAIF family enzyme [Lepidopterella palustris CBS 459.81]